MKLLVVFLLVTVQSTLAQLIQSPVEVRLYLLRQRVKLLTNKLYEQCPSLLRREGFVGSVRRTGYDTLTAEQNLEIEVTLYNHVKALMRQCQQLLASLTSTTVPTTTTNPPTTSTSRPITSTSTSTTTISISTATTSPRASKTTTTTYPPTTTSSFNLPSQCTSSSTLNLTEGWRKDSPDTNPRNNDIEILKPGETWFRFSGAAGNLLKNTCPGLNRCGSSGAYWSDSPLPTQVGETVSITFYESWSTGSVDEARCKYYSYRGRATRCSADRGVVYIMDDAMSSESDTVCGMD